MYSNVRSTNYQAKLIGRLVRVSVTLIQKIPAKYMNTAWAKKTNVRNSQVHSRHLMSQILLQHSTHYDVVFFTPTQHSLRKTSFFSQYCIVLQYAVAYSK